MQLKPAKLCRACLAWCYECQQQEQTSTCHTPLFWARPSRSLQRPETTDSAIPDGLQCTVFILFINISYIGDLDAPMKIMKRIKISTRKAASYNLLNVVQCFLVYAALTTDI